MINNKTKGVFCMFDKRLMAMCPESKKYIVGNIICQWTELMMNAVMIYIIANAVGKLYRKEMTVNEMIISLLILAGILFVRFFMTKKTTEMSLRERSFTRNIWNLLRKKKECSYRPKRAFLQQLRY